MTSPRSIWFLAVVLLPALSSAATGDVVTSFPSSFPSPDGLTWDGEYLWATDCGTSRIDRVDPADGRVVGSVDVTGINSDELSWDGTAMWMSDHTATEMPGMGAPPPALYRVDLRTKQVLAKMDPPGPSLYPMGLGWTGTTLWNVDPWDRKIFEIDPATGEAKRSIPSPANGSCGLTFDGACLWLTDAATNGLVYHIDPATGEVLRSFAGPGGAGHQSTGVAWDGTNLWVHDEATGRAKIHKLAVEDITEGGRCAGARRPAASTPGAGAEQAGSDSIEKASTGGCNSAAAPAGGFVAGLFGALARRRARK